MRSLLRVVGLFGGIGLLVYGLIPKSFTPYVAPRISDSSWILLLWLAGLLLGLAAWASLPALHTTGTRFNVRPGLLNLALAFSILFVLLTLQLLRSSFIYADSIYYRSERNPDTGVSVSNARPVIRSLRIQRGGIFDRNNVQLAGSKVVPSNGLAQRTYPIAQQADIRAFSNILGYSSATYGQEGLEQQWNSYLTGEQGQALRSLTDQLYNKPSRGSNLQLTIDARLQSRVWDILNQRGQGKPASAIVMDPRSGAVLALASTPGFDPQSLALNPANSDDEENKRISAAWKAINADEKLPLINRPLQGQYVPGSTFKTLTAIGALENPSVYQQPPIDCPNEYRPDPNAPPVVNAVGPPRRPDQPPLAQIIQSGTKRPVDLPGVYAFSCNTAFAQLGVRLGAQKFIDLAKRFHIYLPQDAPQQSSDFTDLPMQPSFLASQNNFLNYNLALADTAFGQGQLQVTPMQMALIGATIANPDGIMPQPYLVDSVTDAENPSVQLYKHTPPSNILGQRRLISPDVQARMRQMLRDGVTIGFGKAANVNNSGGKSGSGEAGNNIIHAAFLAIAPVDQPRYVVYVQIENGRDGAGLGAQTAGDVLKAAFDILK